MEKIRGKIEDKHVPDIMDLSDLENTSESFSISYSGSDTFLSCVNLANYRKTHRKHRSSSDL